MHPGNKRKESTIVFAFLVSTIVTKIPPNLFYVLGKIWWWCFCLTIEIQIYKYMFLPNAHIYLKFAWRKILLWKKSVYGLQVTGSMNCRSLPCIWFGRDFPQRPEEADQISRQRIVVTVKELGKNFAPAEARTLNKLMFVLPHIWFTLCFHSWIYAFIVGGLD